MGLLSFVKDKVSAKIGDAELKKQLGHIKREQQAVLSSEDLTPTELKGAKRSYHYKDVCPWIIWQYSGRYGKSCETIGIKRGDIISLTPVKDDDDPEAIGVYYKKTLIGHLRTNRLRSMIISWQASKLPVIAYASAVGGEHKLLLEIAFYGRPNK